MHPPVRQDEYRVLILPATRRDAEVTKALLERAGLACAVCSDAQALASEIENAAGAVLFTDAAFNDRRINAVLDALRRQPPWSDIPSIVLCRIGAQSKFASEFLKSVGNVTLLERPTSSRTLVSSVKAGIRARERQYQIREQLIVLQDSEATLREREQQLHTLASNTPDILSRFDRNLRHIFVNQAASLVTGLSPESFLNRTHRELGIPAELSDSWEAALSEVFASGKRLRVPFSYTGASGTHHYDALLIPELGAVGTVETVLCVTHDITESKRAAQALEDANRRKDEFLAMLAHELRNPLAPILNASEVLARRLGADEQVQSTVDLVKRQVIHLTRLVDDLLDVSRITEGRIDLRRAPIGIAAILSQSRESVEPLMREKGHTLLGGSGYESLYVNGDHARLVQSVANVLTNAAKYTEPGGEIRLEVQRSAGDAVIAVSDNGIGISADLLPRVFDLFVQADRSLDRSQGGLGIGLSLVKRLIEMHGGHVRALSDGPGRGSRFEITLPLIEPPRTSAIEPSKSRISPKRILVVDDNADAADSLAALLELDGHVTEAAYTAKDGIERALAGRPDVVLLDIGLPSMNGYEVAANIRSGLGAVQLIALTGYGQAEDIRRTKAAGFDAHLVKPVDFAALARILGEFDLGRSI